MNLTTSFSATGLVIPDQFSEPTHIGVETVPFDPAQVKTKRELQNRQSHGKNEVLKEDESGFFVYSDSQNDLAMHYIAKAKAGIPSEEAVPEVVIAKLANEQYLIDGHHRLSGLVLARKYALNEEYQKEYEFVGTDLVPQLQNIRVDYWECKNEYELKILADRSNSNSQHGRRLTNNELATMIEGILRDPLKAQFSDMAIATKFLNYPGARGNIQRRRAKMVKDGEIEKVEKTIDINGTPRKAVRPGASKIEALNTYTDKLQTAMDAYVADPQNGKLAELGEASGNWKYTWKEAVQYLNEEEKAEMTTWLADLYKDVEGVNSPLHVEEKPAEPVANEQVDTAPTETTETPQETADTETDDAADDVANEQVDETSNDDAAIIAEVESAAAGVNATPAETTDSRSDKIETLMNTLADAVSLMIELELNEYVDAIEDIIGKVSEDTDETSEGDEQ